MTWLRTPGEGAYARDEVERRWRLDALPEGLEDERRICDRYVTGTRLRLRAVEGGGVVVHKLAQKVPHGDGVRLTNLYLDEAEARVLAALPAAELRKTRWTWTYAGRAFAVERHDDGLLLAETEVARLDEPVEVPDGWLEVTVDPAFSGGALAQRSASQAAASRLGARDSQASSTSSASRSGGTSSSRSSTAG